MKEIGQIMKIYKKDDERYQFGERKKYEIDL